MDILSSIYGFKTKRGSIYSLNLLFFLLFYIVFPQFCAADFKCYTNITIDVKEAEETKTVSWKEVEALGKTDVDAKAILNTKVNKYKKKAENECAARKLTTLRCITNQYADVEEKFKALSFNSRKAIEESIQEGCKKLESRCLEIKSSEPQCLEIKKEEAENAEEGKDKKGGKGKDKKK
jgi:hypothetical protein